MDKAFEEHASGKSAERPAFQACLEYVRDGDVAHVHSIDRLARNLWDLLTIITELQKQKVTLKFHKENLALAGGSDAIQGDAFQDVAQFERALILEWPKYGIAIAKKKGKYKNVNRKSILSNEQLNELSAKLENGDKVIVLAQKYGVSGQMIYSWVRVRA